MRLPTTICWALMVLACWRSPAADDDLLVEHRPGSTAHLTTQGMTAHRQQKFATAIDFYRQALELDDRYFPALYNLALAYQQDGQLDLSRKRYLEALQVRPDHPEVHNNLGVLAYQQGKYQEAVSRFTAAAEVSREDDHDAAGYRYNLGTAHEGLGQWIDAQRAYLACLDLAPHHFGACYNLGTLYLGPLKNAKEGERYLAKAAKNAPHRPEPLVNLAVLAERRRAGDAGKFYNQAVQVAAADQPRLLPDMLWLRARYYDRLVPPQKVAMRRDLQELLRLDPNYPGANGMLGLHYEALGQFDEAITHLEREIGDEGFDRDDPIGLECLYTLARIFYEVKKDSDRALRYGTAYYRLLPESPKAKELRRRSLRLPQKLEQTIPIDPNDE